MLLLALGLAAIPAAVLLFVLAGYPLLVRLRATGRQAPSDVAIARAKVEPAAELPEISVVVATRDAPQVVAARVRNLRASAYPADRMEVVVSVDARAAEPLSAYVDAVNGQATVVRGDEPGGKAAGLNAGVRAARGSVLVFADSQQSFSPNTITDLVTGLRGEGVGAVGGRIVSAKDDPLMDRYWEYEVAIRRRQAAIHSIICVSGAVYALRRELWRPMPPALICDDLFVTQGLVLRGWRVGFCETARAEDPREFTRQQHFDRKVRTLTGLIQLCVWEPAVLLPWRNAMWIDFAIHKLTRIIIPYLALLSLVGIAWTAYLVLGGLVVLAAAVVTALVAALVLLRRPALGTSALWAGRLFMVPLIATANALRGRWHVWASHAAREADTRPPAPAARTLS
ncbi:putative glycosyltransferase [Gemmatirosa kalamazoonensis]|uniref:Putative glycosyltransferase n=1 Tax=Gemmatirosa kalamazoonensis TaxID=861299 RepID=W0RKR1_9BACT|nr:glycosyltransferase [Gemmatirosa kalamazoonensis]AHG90023.1 putative glycosyltransferase [Gemmatirosa kalamazoonensis]